MLGSYVGRRDWLGGVWFYCNGLREEDRKKEHGREERERDREHARAQAGEDNVFSSHPRWHLQGWGAEGWCLVLVSHPPALQTGLWLYGDLSFLVRGEVPFSAFTTPFS